MFQSNEVWLDMYLGKHVEGGDSGGPIFFKAGDEAYIAGVIQRYDAEGHPFYDVISKGTTAQTVEQHNGGAFISTK